MYFFAMAILIGAALNASIDQVWPSQHTAQARAERDKERVAAEIATALEHVRRSGRHRRTGEPGEIHWTELADDETTILDPVGDVDEPPAEFPERWANLKRHPAPSAAQPQRRGGAHRAGPSPSGPEPAGTLPVIPPKPTHPPADLAQNAWRGRPPGM
jgi:membrane protein